ncbi:hypothetical protein KCU88_g2335, partial [Aureobasidium melanogenum]
LNSNYEKPSTETDSGSLGSSKSDDNLAGATSKTPNEKSKLTAKEKRKSKQLPPRPTLPDSEIHHVYLKGTGPGGQKINKTNSAAQLTHLPTGIVKRRNKEENNKKEKDKNNQTKNNNRNDKNKNKKQMMAPEDEDEADPSHAQQDEESDY